MAKKKKKKVFITFVDSFLGFFGRDYWQTPDNNLVGLAQKYKLISEKRLQDIIDEMQEMRKPKNLFFRFPLLDHETRREIVYELINRDKFANSFIAIAISLLALIVSGIALVKSR